MTDISPQVLAAAQQLVMQHLSKTTKAAVSTTPTTAYGHGVGGLFSDPALERPLFSAMMLPRQGLLSRLPTRENRFANPLYGIVTGVSATTDTATPAEATMGPCDDPPVAGLMKLCEQTIYFGRQSRMTRVFELDRMGLLSNRGEHLDFQLMNNPLGVGNTGSQAPTIPGMGANAALNSEVGKALFEFGTAWSRDFAAEVYTGNPSNNAPAGGRKYFRGFDLLINTGYKDAITGVACTAADSIVRSAGNINISSDVTGARTVYRNITDIFRNLQFNARNMGFASVKWVIAMRATLFYELTEVWPIVYATTRGLAFTSAGTPINSSFESLNAMRDNMRGDLYGQTGQYLTIDGQQVEVVLDDSIAETNVGSGTYSSAIYFVPLTANGAEVCSLEYLPYTGDHSFMEAAAAFNVGAFYNTSDNGRFAWHFKPPTNFCVQFLAKTEPRIVLRTPYLAARYTTIRYTPVSHERDWNPSGTYYQEGGVTNYNGYGPSYNTPT
jgi:hypothetical protein